MFSIIIIMSLSSYALYRWRINLSNNKGELKELLTPENFNSIMNKLNKNIDKSEINVKSNTDSLLKMTKSNEEHISTLAKENSKDIDSLKDVVMSFQSKIDFQEEEIKRLKYGYDNFVLKNYFNKLVNIKKLVEFMIEKETVHNLRQYLQSAASRCKRGSVSVDGDN